MISEVVNNGGTLEFRSLAGASAAGLPVGSILALHTNRVPAGYLPCNGATYDITQYPALYTILQTNVLPDLREANLVGAGANTTHSITTHDTYTVGQFKDDQVQEIVTGAESETSVSGCVEPHCHCMSCHSSTSSVGSGSVGTAIMQNVTTTKVFTSGAYVCCEGGTVAGDPKIIATAQTTTTLTTDANARTGSVTHGKNYGVFFVIKAVTGITELDDAEVYAQVVNLLESNYIQKSLFSEGGIPMYNSTTECFDQITPPSTSGKALTYDPATCCYSWGETASAVSNLTDVCLTNLCDGQYLQYDATNCTWNNVTLTVDSSCISCNCSLYESKVTTTSNGTAAGTAVNIFNGDETGVYSQIALGSGTIDYTTYSSGSSDSFVNMCQTTGIWCVSTSDSWHSSEYSSSAYICANGHNIELNAVADNNNGGCILFNGDCSACYDGNTGILYVHAICFI